jgi:hypothetical protein
VKGQFEDRFDERFGESLSKGLLKGRGLKTLDFPGSKELE